MVILRTQVGVRCALPSFCLGMRIRSERDPHEQRPRRCFSPWFSSLPSVSALWVLCLTHTPSYRLARRTFSADLCSLPCGFAQNRLDNRAGVGDGAFL